MEGLIKEISERRANRAFSENKIPEDIIQRIMTAATYAPSCFNNQAWRFLVAKDDDSLKKIHDTISGGNYWVKKAPAVVVVATQHKFACQLNDQRDYAFFDCGLAVENLLLQAVKEGLYAHPIAGYEPIKVKELFNIPMEYIIITLVALGYPGDDSHLNEKHKELEHSPRNRKPEEEVICYDKWGFDS
jgi:nitroreductase